MTASGVVLSDDLTDMSYDHRGVFPNIVGTL